MTLSYDICSLIDRWGSDKIVLNGWEKNWNEKLQLMDIFYIWLMEIQAILHDSCMRRKKDKTGQPDKQRYLLYVAAWIVNHKIHIKNNYKQLIIQTTG